MDEKKKILFVMNNLNVGGAEKALVSLLQVFDYEKYEVDLFLFKKEGAFLKYIPQEVDILPVPENYIYFDGSAKKAIIANLKKLNLRLILDRIKFGVLQKRKFPTAEKEQRSWKYIKNHMCKLTKEYDVAIGFLEKTPIYFCVDRVISHQKIGFIHTDYKKAGINRLLDFDYFAKLNKIATVSIESCNTLQHEFPSLYDKFYVVQNIISTKEIQKLSMVKITLISTRTIVSVGRLVSSKGYELSLEAFKILKKKNVDFTWIIVGDGTQRSLIKKRINNYGLSKNVILLGSIQNPYPYIRMSDIFLHAAIFEGDGIVVREAQILNKPIILTNFATAKNHITAGVTGIISETDPSSLAKQIERLLLDENLRELFSNNLAKENWGTERELQKFYNLIES